jgi:glutathione S-transferase
MLKLFISPGACALASHIGLEEAGADFETQVVDLRSGQQRTPEYLAINPAGSTPALQTERGVITQNAAILAFIAQTHPDRNLAPVDDPHAFAAFNAFNGFLSSSLHPAIGKVLFSRPPLEQALAKYQLVEDHWLKGPLVFGDGFTLADGYLSVFTRWARSAQLLDLARFPGLNAHLDRVQARPAVSRALANEGLSAV